MFNKLSRAVKKNKLPYYAKNIARQLIPAMLYRGALKKRLKGISRFDKAALLDRVNYYNKLNNITAPGNNATVLGQMEIFKSPKAYNFDTYEYTRYFDTQLKANFLFGDVTHVATVPSIQKSRPVNGDNANAVLLKLDKKRHFVFIKDAVKFEDKKDMLIGRGVMSQPHRIRFMELYFDNALCNLGQVNKNSGNPDWIKPKITIDDHLRYKFILSLEGNDVATNLKWIMSSNSIAVMPRPKYETWFMEGRLVGGYHYIQLKDDFSDLATQLQYYIEHPQKAKEIVLNANNYVKQFSNKPQEDLLSLLVLEKYFYYTGQTDSLTDI